MNVKARIKQLFIFTTVFVCILHGFHGSLRADELLKNLFTNQKWQQIAGHFSDNSFQVLKNYFSTAKSVTVIAAQNQQMSYKAKFLQQGEIGVITFDKKAGKYFNLKIKNQIRPLYFIESFKKYKVHNLVITIGDARIRFIDGYFYETLPFHSLLLFQGNWTFDIKPGDYEEQLTLKRRFRRDHFSRSPNTGIFFLEEKEFLNKLPEAGQTTQLDDSMQELYSLYRDAYGIHIPQFNEYWFLPFPQETNLVIFKRDKKSFFFYSFNRGQVPDTQLSESGDNDMILSYNAHKGLKLSFGVPDTIENVNLSLFFNPDSRFISGTAAVTYKNASSLRVLTVADGINLVGNLSLDSKGLNVFRKRDKYYLMGSESIKMALYFNGNIAAGPENFELFKASMPVPKPLGPQGKEDKKDTFFFLSKTDNYYPNPGNEFFNAEITIALPGHLNCLASGNLVERKLQDTALYKFKAARTKGISMVVGTFKLRKKENARIPLHFYTPSLMKFPKDLDLGELKKAAALYLDSFGPLDLKHINILLKRSNHEGGISNPGFIVVNLPHERKHRITGPYLTTAGDKVLNSPILIRGQSEDHILHELAHQWWGGVISWKSYHDLWLTEGLSHFSVLYFLKKNLPEKRFVRLVRKLKRWVYKHTDTGPIVYGTRINMLEDKYEAYQSVIYNKSSLVFLMAMDMLGEKEFIRRLKRVVADSRYKSLNSMQFIRAFSDKKQDITGFFKSWIYSRTIPQVELKVETEDKETDNQTFKQVVLSIHQIDTEKPFVFPLTLRVTTKKGSTSLERLVMSKMVQRLVVKRKSAIRSVDVVDDFSLVREKKQPNPALIKR